MKRQIEWMVYGIMLLLSVGCREDVDALYGVKSRPGIPVCFTTAWPQGVAGLKRGIADKKDFKEADVIHVSAEFTLDPLTTESQTEEKVTKYTILTLENGAWVNTRTEEQYEMTWPGTRRRRSSRPIIWKTGRDLLLRLAWSWNRWCWTVLRTVIQCSIPTLWKP